MTKFYAQEKRVFDINKVTVVGSPSISEDGVASGFTTANYIASSTTLTINPNIFRICFEFTTSSDITTTQMIIRSMDGQNAFIIGLKSRKMRLYLNEGDSPLSWGVASDILSTKVLTANTKYSGCLSFNGFTYTLSLNNEDWITVKSSALIRSSFALKIGQGMSTEPFLGSVNLQAIRVYSNNELVYSPTKPICYLERRKEGFDLSKFTVVGSPTITDDGVASGFSASDYIEVETPLNTSNFTLEGEIVVPEVLGVEHGLIQFNNTTKTRVIIGASTIFSLYDDTAGRIIGCETNQFRGNTIKYKFEVLPSGSKLTINDLTQNETFTYTSTKNLTLSNVSSFTIGKSFHGGYGGQIDLSQISITVNDKEVFTGAKEKFYAMRGM